LVLALLNRLTEEKDRVLKRLVADLSPDNWQFIPRSFDKEAFYVIKYNLISASLGYYKLFRIIPDQSSIG